jgi:hypothetical protein
MRDWRISRTFNVAEDGKGSCCRAETAAGSSSRDDDGIQDHLDLIYGLAWAYDGVTDSILAPLLLGDVAFIFQSVDRPALPLVYSIYTTSY